MPTSSKFGKAQIRWVMSKIPAPQTALDVGCGEGTYAKMFPAIEWTGVEIWEPYIERYHLKDYYKQIECSDIRDWNNNAHYDVCFLGDVLEHMPEEDAKSLLSRARDMADTVIISIPIGYHPQGEWEGNPHEQHITDDWTVDAFIKAFGKPTIYFHDNEIGVFVYSKHKIKGNFEVEKDQLCLIPKVIHIVWIGDETKRPDNMIATWKEKNPDWVVKIWGNKEYQSRNWINKAHMEAVWNTQIYGVADMMRYEILHEEGGFCIDADSLCENTLDDVIFNAPTVFFYENEQARPGLIANGYMASVHNNDFFLKIIYDIKNDTNIPNVAACMATGPFRLTEAVKKYAPQNIKIMPSHLFMPKHHTGKAYKGTEKVYGQQFWGSSGKKEPIKICVYAISKNEEQFVKRFCEHAKDADLILIADTGSTDGTADVARECGAVVHNIVISPWRFDHARNAALALVPRDIDVCVSLDLDEILEPGWRERIEAAWEKGKTTRLRYMFDWGCGIRFTYEKIHARHGYHWHHPCHEYPRADGRITEIYAWAGDELLVSHHPDPTKSRGQYLDLLALSVKEDPHCPRNAFYYARELTFYSKWDEAIVELNRYLNLPEATWPNERCYAMRLLGKSYAEKGDIKTAEKWYFQAASEAPNTREPWCELAMLLYRQGRWEECFAMSMRALSIKDKQLVYTCDPAVWGHWAHDLASIAAWHLGLKDEAYKHAKNAVELSPDDDRLKANLLWIEKALQPEVELEAAE